MSQEYFDNGHGQRDAPASGGEGNGDSSRSATHSYSSHTERQEYQRPNYMTVGGGTASEHAHKLAEMLEQDSGYGGSIMDGAPGWNLNASADMPSPMFTPTGASSGHLESESDRRTMAGHIHQLQYNHNRGALGRAITRTMDALKKLQEKNKEWPAHYPSVQQPVVPHSGPDPRPGMHHTQSHIDGPLDRFKARPSALRRAETMTPDGHGEKAESSAVAAKKPAPEPRLVTPQLARDFSVLKIDLKMDGLPQTEIIHSLRKDSKALAQLLDGQINKSMRHLINLRERIEDTSSKVLITGDLNAGKSTFCNALLRRKILPEDEQPCTSIFCEVLDVRENGGVEEVHAIPIGLTYNRNDERTYVAFPLKKLDSIVVDNEHYTQCKVYVADVRSVDESLLNNGVLDIALIDAPGLNNDSLKTTAVFARQEEIDVVVFVVSAANHFTLSAREFIYDAAREKAYIFMVVNGFDNIRNKQRCQEQILKQVAHLSPATFKESRELVHFVSSNAVPVAPIGGRGPTGGPSSAGSAQGVPNFDNDDDDGSEGDDDDDEPQGKHGEPGSSADKGKGKEKQKMQDFEHLEASLRRFVLEKRARSKLAPAKTYLINVLDDLHSLATVNRDVAQGELDRVIKELQSLEPVLEESRRARNEASDAVDQQTEELAEDVYAHTRETVDSTIANVASQDLGVEYPGFLNAYQYADDIVSAMLQNITSSVGDCEQYAREKTAEGVSMVKSIGILHLGDKYTELLFQSDRMLRRKKDALARQVDIEIDVWDFFDLTSLWERQEKVVGSGMALTAAGALGSSMLGGIGWIDGTLGLAKVMGTNNLRRLFVPGLLLGVTLAVSYAITSIPQSLPRRLNNKVAAQLAAIDFTHGNAVRISSEVRKALKIPANDLRMGLQKNFEQLQNKREETTKIKIESEVARKYFGNLVRDSHDIKSGVERVDLEGAAPGLAGSYES